MPGVTPREMNGYKDYSPGYGASYMYDPYSRGREDVRLDLGGLHSPGHRPVPHGSVFTDPPSARLDLGGLHSPGRRPVAHGSVFTDPPSARREDPYSARIPRNGFGEDIIDESSVDGGPDRDGQSFEVDHLATFTFKSGPTNPEDGLSKLKQMENTTGVWTMRCQLIIERRHVVIVDKNTGDEVERFPVYNVLEPTAIIRNDRREVYNNLILFSVCDDPGRKNASADMHIFQSIRAPAQQVVEIMLKNKGHGVQGGRTLVPPPPSKPAPMPPVHNRFGDGQYAGHATSMRPGPFVNREELDAGQNEALERDVQLLNNCFDDIEKFVSRLQQAAEAFKELERRKKDHSKKKQSGQGMLHMRARAPPSIDFIDIFQKFKFAFNLLAKLKAHIHDPNAPELVHFLFTPLSLIYEASRDPSHGGEDLSDKAIAPLLTNDSKQLLLNCLTSKELELWQRLGRSWTDTREDARGYIPAYSPKFYNGWQPFPQGVDSGPAYRLEQVEQPTPRLLEETLKPAPISTYDDRYAGRQTRYDRDRDRYDREYPDREIESERNFPIRQTRKEEFRPLTPPPGPSRPHQHEIRPPSPPLQTRDYDVGRREQMFDRQPPMEKITRKPMTRQEENIAYLRELQRMEATIYEAVHDRAGRNTKELTIEKGDILQVLDSNRNWWKLKNYKGEVGYAPYTILKAIDTNDDDRDRDQNRFSGDYNSYIPNSNGSHMAPPAPIPPPMPSDKKSTSGAPRSREFEDKREMKRPLPTTPGTQQNKDWSQPMPEYQRKNANLQEELKAKMKLKGDELPVVQMRHPHPGPNLVQLSEDSPPYEVREWLESKGFNMRTIDTLEGYSGYDLFSLRRSEMERLLGKEEARHLESQVTVMKNRAGYKTQSKFELNAILQRRRERADSSDPAVNKMRQPPNFQPETPPDYSPDVSDESSDDFGDAGKTLRNLLERQRRKINEQQYNYQ